MTAFEQGWSIVKASDEWKLRRWNPEWMDYYNMLESIRESGITNMFGAGPYLAQVAGIDENLAQKILGSWMDNYSELMEHPDYRRNG